jgi:tRNA nucleotidyltransferase (CCA-adding enzyme)
VNIKERIENFLSQSLPIERAWLPQDAYLVGGSVRDVLLSRQKERFDLDFVVAEGAIDLARRISRQYGGGFVVLDDLRCIARVVFPQGTIDLAQREGDSMETDLRRRDFTINAIAYSLHDRLFCDPHNGLEDLQNETLRTISRANLADDPLRLLRGYRQAAQLNFSIEPVTKNIIRELAPLLDRVAAERVNMELGYLLDSPCGSEWLVAAADDRLLDSYFPNLNADKLLFLYKIDENMAFVANFSHEVPEKSILWRSMARLACLLDRDPATAEREMMALKYSRQEIRTIVTAIEHLPQLSDKRELPSLREQYFFFLAVGESLPILAVLSLAFGGDRTIIRVLFDRYLDPQDPVAHPQPIVTGTDLIEQLNLKPSPTIGKLLTEIQIAYLEGKVSNFNEAIEFGRKIVG